jgi:hypothetical protein
MNARATDLDSGILACIARAWMPRGIRRITNRITNLDTFSAYVVTKALVAEIGVCRLSEIFKQIKSENRVTKL